MVFEEQPIVIGIDFGTTYSGIAWAPVGSYIATVSDWPEQPGFASDKQKTPTSLLYRSEGKKPSWGSDIPANETPLRWFKLLLLDKNDLPQHIRGSQNIREARSLLRQSNRHVVEVIGDYIRELWQHSLRDMESSLGKRRVASSPFQVVVTLPAIWPAYARMRMREALNLAGVLDARSAGETTLGFVSEPEAAALATVKDCSGRVNLKRNDHFVVCDAGGGTVDIITYKVRKEGPIKVVESVKGDGKLCGAVFLDERFLALLKSKIPREIWDRMGVSGVRSIMSSYWENGLKKQFRAEAEVPALQLPYGGTVANRFQTPSISFDRKTIMDIFKPIVAEVEELVRKQVRAVIKTYKTRPKYVILVGGFGKSRFLRESLQSAIEEVSPTTEILQAGGDQPWTAVCRGAVLKGFGKCDPNAFAVVDACIARASYGTTYNVLPWDVDEHDVRDKAWCPIQQEFLAVDQTKWFVRNGETLWADVPVTETFWQDLEKPDDTIETEIVYSAAASPPYRCDSSVKHLCMIRWSKVPDFDKLPVWKNKKGKAVRQVCYDLRMVPDGISMDFQIIHDGTMVASKNVNVDFAGSGTTFKP